MNDNTNNDTINDTINLITDAHGPDALEALDLLGAAVREYGEAIFDDDHAPFQSAVDGLARFAYADPDNLAATIRAAIMLSYCGARWYSSTTDGVFPEGPRRSVEMLVEATGTQMRNGDRLDWPKSGLRLVR